MAVSRHQVVHEKLARALEAMSSRDGPGLVLPSGMSPEFALELFTSQLTSRLIDFEARAMKARDEGYYTIGSAGHEGSACVAACLEPEDICFLHYRSGAFMMQRARQFPGETPVFDTLLSLAASAEDPASGGRHKVWGSKRMNVPPQTSTIASHLPKALGAAFAIGRTEAIRKNRSHRARAAVPDEQSAIAMASFGDASLNHSTALGAINAAAWACHQRLPLPLLLVCEDNQIGISVRTPSGWIEPQYPSRQNLGYFRGDGLDLVSAHSAARAAVDWVRQRRRPALLHLRMVRLMGHAGSDIEQSYRSNEEIEAGEALDPVVRSAQILVDAGVCDAGDLLRLYHELTERIQRASREASRRRKLTSAAEIMSSLAPIDEAAFAEELAKETPPDVRLRIFGGEDRLPEKKRPRHMAMLLNWGLHDLMIRYPEILIFGEDVAKKGGVYNVTTQLYERFGVARVFNTLLDEQSVLGVALGAAQVGYLPCPEIQYLAYLVHASDQIRGEAASQQFFSNGAFANPMVIRVAGLAYQKGFGGHFHNDNGFAFLREIPGLILAAPSRGDDAVGVLRTCFALAKSSGRVVVFLEPIALYMAKDLYEDGDEAWNFKYPPLDHSVPLGEVRIYGAEPVSDLTIVTYANGVPMSLRVAKRLEARGHRVRVVDLRWLTPLPREALLDEAAMASRVLVVDEGRRTGGIGEEILALLAESGPRGLPLGRVAGKDCYVPLAAAANLVLVSEADIEKKARQLLAEEGS
ncbi:MAG: MFS transporter [Planctomycetes bacterium]|nr:MFS transporter [Planctomycetota bacterium]